MENAALASGRSGKILAPLVPLGCSFRSSGLMNCFHATEVTCEIVATILTVSRGSVPQGLFPLQSLYSIVPSIEFVYTPHCSHMLEKTASHRLGLRNGWGVQTQVFVGGSTHCWVF